MEDFTLKDLKRLTTENEDFVISFTMPGINTTTANEINKLEFAALLKEAEQKLGLSNINHNKIQDKLKSAYNFYNDDSVWQTGFQGLAVYANGKSFSTYILPFPPKKEVSVSHYFNILPLINYYYINPSYYILIIDEAEVRLFQADKTSLKEIDLKNSFETERQYFDRTFEKEEIPGYRSEISGRGRTKNHEDVIYHGHGNAKDDRKIRARRFFQQSNEAFNKALLNEPAEVILVGHDHLISIYREVTHNDQLNKNHIRPNPGKTDLNHIHQKANEIIQEKVNEELGIDLDHFYNEIGSGHTTSDVNEIIDASQKGKIEILFYDKNNYVYGTLTQKNNSITAEISDDPSDENLTNIILAHSINAKAKIWPLLKEKMPETSNFSALLKY